MRLVPRERRIHHRNFKNDAGLKRMRPGRSEEPHRRRISDIQRMALRPGLAAACDSMLRPASLSAPRERPVVVAIGGRAAIPYDPRLTQARVPLVRDPIG